MEKLTLTQTNIQIFSEKSDFKNKERMKGNITRSNIFISRPIFSASFLGVLYLRPT
jgi:hypothetical protein